MQFQVPQFIEVEDKIFGPLTFKQFLYVGGGLGASYILWRILPIYLAGPLILSVGGLAAGLAFFRYNGRPFILGLEHAFYFFLRSKLYLWNNARKKNVIPPIVGKLAPREDGEMYVPKLSDSKLHELSWSLDIKERIAQGVVSDREREAARSEGDIVAPIRTARDLLQKNEA
ncbi:hypothetical protein COU18_00300 [Candidatus Kaiserbacteria bacterium CG10_big_fil_rev_8_21_14_0_10_51_14]|uniref:PrgI family protein n=1 Tax=Candidatus Kaiserbacteria bacterium CG10_big_fil_rev_8_21_14_0_10_51_14 TaxID=1974610 RepID=A0A2H0UCR0_9BACT|nr:MAG: hypothetical protein COU18_00300 [Candidatus Kaiserbacteria bacterium CG10_big_fil_rev_8_21_14_0_10_51_14]